MIKTYIVFINSAVFLNTKIILKKAFALPEDSLVIRGLRQHASSLLKSLVSPQLITASEKAVSRAFSRSRMGIDDESTSDNMIIQSSKILEQLDKDTNMFYMRIKEWYGYHFPELIKIIEDPVAYVACVRAIGPRKNLSVFFLR